MPRLFLSVCVLTVLLLFPQVSSRAQTKAAPTSPTKVKSERAEWLAYLDKLARPVLEALAVDSLKIRMPVRLSPKSDNPKIRRKVAYLEAFGRTMSGISGWLQLEGGDAAEVQMRDRYRDLVIRSLRNAVDSQAKDYLFWCSTETAGRQPLVDASYLALAMIRCPWIWEHTDAPTRAMLAEAFDKMVVIKPHENNWILFPSMIEAFRYRYGLPYDSARLVEPIMRFWNEWYAGDGMFDDGPEFHLDYYNSIAIQTYLAPIIELLPQRFAAIAKPVAQIAERYAEIQERTINPDGSYMATGRSLVYRGGVFFHLADAALRHRLPRSLKPAQVRGALTAMMRKTLRADSTFDAQGWLNIGLYGKQPSMGDAYITTGSLYMCTNALLPLGLPASDPFWSDPPASWTSKKIWSGEDFPADHALPPVKAKKKGVSD